MAPGHAHPPSPSGNSAATLNAASWSTASPVPAAPTADTTSWSLTPASVAASARPAQPAAWSRPRRIWPTTSSRVCLCASAASRLGAVIFIHRFGALLNTHLHFHCIVVDGVFEADAEGGAAFHPASGLDAAAIGEVQVAVRRRLLSADDAQVMATWEHGGGFSVDAEVRIEAHEREGLERLLRYCARPAFALERLTEIDPGHLVYESVKPGPGGSVSLMLTPMQLLDRVAALIPPPRKHRHRYYGVLAPNSPLRDAVTALAQPAEAPTPATVAPISPEAAVTTAPDPPHRQAARYVWVLLLARIY